MKRSIIESVAYELKAYAMLQSEFGIIKKQLSQELELLAALCEKIDTVMTEKQ
jgi:hypothetical protein